MGAVVGTCTMGGSEMGVAYMIHRIGTPRKAWRGHYSEWACEYWSHDNGWGHPSTGDVFTADEKGYLDLPLDGEWVEILVEMTSDGE